VNYLVQWRKKIMALLAQPDPDIEATRPLLNQWLEFRSAALSDKAIHWDNFLDGTGVHSLWPNTQDKRAGKGKLLV
jgi:hypothetical protein